MANDGWVIGASASSVVLADSVVVAPKYTSYFTIEKDDDRS